MAKKIYILNGSVADQQINNSVDLSFLNKISWVKTEKQPKGEVSGPLSWKIDGKAPGLEGATFYKYNNSSAKLYGIWDLSGQFDLKNLPKPATAVLKGGVSGEFIGVIAIDESLKIVNGPVFTKDISLKDIKVIDNYAQAKYGGFTTIFLGLSGDQVTQAQTMPSLSTKTDAFKNLCDIILAETIKSYLL